MKHEHEHEHELALVTAALSEGQRYGKTHPRRWLQKHGGITSVYTGGNKNLANRYREYRHLRLEIAALTPKQQDNWLPDQTYRLIR